MTVYEDPMFAIDYQKYLNCPKCQEEELYCQEHKREVEVLLVS